MFSLFLNECFLFLFFPVDTYRVRLTMREATEGTDYINASYLDVSNFKYLVY